MSDRRVTKEEMHAAAVAAEGPIAGLQKAMGLEFEPWEGPGEFKDSEEYKREQSYLAQRAAERAAARGVVPVPAASETRAAAPSRPGVGAHWLDPEPGQGRSARAAVIANTVDGEEILDGRRFLVEWQADLFFQERHYARNVACSTPGLVRHCQGKWLAEVRRDIASCMVRISIATRALRLQKLGERNTCKVILDAATEPL